MAFAIFRIAKLKSAAACNGAAAHNNRDRLDESGNLLTYNADPERGQLNRIVNTTDDNGQELSGYAAVMQTLADNDIDKVRSNAVLAVEVLISASPEYFRPNDPSAAGTWDKDKLDAWTQATDKFIKENFPHATSVALHLDESTPHYHIIDVPIDDKGKLNARAKYAGPAGLREWQTKVADSVKHLGIQRGREGAELEYQTVRQGYKAMKDVSKLPNVEKLQEQKPEPFVPGKFFDGKNKDAHIAKQDAYIAKLERAVEQLSGTVMKDAMHGHQVPSMAKALDAKDTERMVAVSKAINAEKMLAADDLSATHQMLDSATRENRSLASANNELLDQRAALKDEVASLKVALAGSEEKFKDLTKELRGLSLHQVAEHLQGRFVQSARYEVDGQRYTGKVYDIPTANGDTRVLVGANAKGDFYRVFDGTGHNDPKYGAINFTMATKGTDFMKAVSMLKPFKDELTQDTVAARVKGLTASIKAEVSKELDDAYKQQAPRRDNQRGWSM